MFYDSKMMKADSPLLTFLSSMFLRSPAISGKGAILSGNGWRAPRRLALS
jgi:hypothetical protein